jgi:mannitol/fructose-specific phosphotransferase system IIA component (Ntr-type)
MVRFRDVLRPEAVRLGVAPEDRSTLLAALAAPLRADDRISSVELFLSHVRRRETEAGTMLGQGLWLPHARSEAVSGLVMSAIRLGAPTEPDGIQAAFLVGIPPAMTADYLRLIGCLARAWKDDTSRIRILASKSSDDFIEALDGVSL